MTETYQERLHRVNLAVVYAKAGMTQAWWSLLGVAVSVVGTVVSWRSPGLAGSLGGMLIVFAGLGYVVWCFVESQRLVRKSRELMKGPE